MAIEIERKFLVADGWRDAVTRAVPMRQGYLGGSRCSVRIRIAGEGAQINIKSRELGRRRLEFEYQIPAGDAHEMLDRLADGALVEKTRHYVEIGDHIWEIDEFAGDNAGLVVAEIELNSEDERFDRPPWLGPEVTDDARYYNLALARHPYRKWSRP